MSWRVGVSALLLAAATIAADDAPTTPPTPQLVFARELQRMDTLHATELVNVLDTAVKNHPASPPLSFLLAIAHAETNGDVLDVSEAGAVGLAQATPVAVRQEGMSGKLYVTHDYLEGARNYILKKPLHDIEVIADDVLEGEPFDEAKQLLASAMKLRREGVDELDLLREWADEEFFKDITSDDARNVAMLIELSRALDAEDRIALRLLRDRAHDEYRLSIAQQQNAWKRYQLDVIERRDAFLEQHFHMSARAARRQYGYPAGEMLAEELDVRFSPTKMAEFLVRHVGHKAMLAASLGASIDQREKVTAALYNGGTHNVKRMMAGLITWLPETENYMRKVPATRRRLDRAVEESNNR